MTADRSEAGPDLAAEAIAALAASRPPPTRPPARAAQRRGWIAPLRYAAGAVGAACALALGQAWVAGLVLIGLDEIPLDLAYLAVAVPLVLAIIGSIILYRRSPEGSLRRPWAGGLAVTAVFLLMLYAGAG